jgi:hypothetical protein
MNVGPLSSTGITWAEGRLPIYDRKFLTRLAERSESDPIVFQSSFGDTIFLEKDWCWQKGTLDFFCGFLFTQIWHTVAGLEELRQWAISENTAVMVSTFDGLETAEEPRVVMQPIEANVIRVPIYQGLDREMVWPAWLARLKRRHRYNIRCEYDLATGYQVEITTKRPPDFDQILQREYDRCNERMWPSYGPYGHHAYQKRWKPLFETMAEVFDGKVQYTTLRDPVNGHLIACDFGMLWGERWICFATLWDDRFDQMGMAVAAHTVRHVIEGQSVRFLDFMSGFSHNKSKYEPDRSIQNWNLAIFPTFDQVGELFQNDVDPPYIAGDRFYQIVGTELPWL